MRFLKKVKEFFAKLKKKLVAYKERKKEEKARNSKLGWIFRNMDECVLTAYMEEDELVVKIRPKEVVPEAA